MDIVDIQIENLREGSRRLYRVQAVGTISVLFYAIAALADHAFTANLTGVTVEFQSSVLGMFALALYCLAGIYGYVLSLQVKKIAIKINPPDIRAAALDFPSAVTSGDDLFRRLFASIPILAALTAALFILDGEKSLIGAEIVMFLGLFAYVGVVINLWEPLNGESDDVSTNV